MGIIRFVSFKSQRAFFALILTVLPTSLSIGVLWNHLDSLAIFTGTYLLLTKIGLLLVESTAIFLLLWDLTSDDEVLSNYCFGSNIVIVLMVLLHVGAVFQYDSALSKLKNTQKETIDGSAKILELNNKLLTEQGAALLGTTGVTSSDDTAADKNLAYKIKRDALKTVIETSAKTNSELAKGVIDKLGENPEEEKISTILPIGYIKSGAMYIVPILIGFLLGVGALFISKTSLVASTSGKVSKEIDTEIKPKLKAEEAPKSFKNPEEDAILETLGDTEVVDKIIEKVDKSDLTKEKILAELNTKPNE